MLFKESDWQKFSAKLLLVLWSNICSPSCHQLLSANFSLLVADGTGVWSKNMSMNIYACGSLCKMGAEGQHMLTGHSGSMLASQPTEMSQTLHRAQSLTMHNMLAWGGHICFTKVVFPWHWTYSCFLKSNRV